jgi:high affinity Mn2+ porin
MLYTYAPFKYLKITADYQFVDNPAYNTDRGPVSVIGLRLHTDL